MDDLVRICALTASLAPAGGLVPARLAAPAVLKPGAIWVLAVDLARTRAGMAAVMRDAGGREVMRARIVDLGDDGARAEVIRVARDAPASAAAGLRLELLAEALP